MFPHFTVVWTKIYKQLTCNLTLSRVRITVVGVWSSITHSQYVAVALVIQHANRMRRIILSSVTCPALPHFSTLSHKGRDFQGKVTEFSMYCLISLKLLSATFLNLRRIQRDIIIHVHRTSRKMVVILVKFLIKLWFSRQIFRNILKYQIWWKYDQWEHSC